MLNINWSPNPTSEWIFGCFGSQKIIGIGDLAPLVMDIMRVQTILVLGPLGAGYYRIPDNDARKALFFLRKTISWL